MEAHPRYDGISGGNPVPLRRAVYLRAHGREIDRTALKEMERSSGCRNYEAYETAMERTSEGKKALFRLTFVKTERGVRVFNDACRVRSVCAGCCRTWRTVSIPPHGKG